MLALVGRPFLLATVVHLRHGGGLMVPVHGRTPAFITLRSTPHWSCQAQQRASASVGAPYSFSRGGLVVSMIDCRDGIDAARPQPELCRLMNDPLAYAN